MYTNDKSFSFRDLLIKIIFLGLFVALLIWLFPKVNMKPFYSNVFRENISYMQDAARSYFTTDKLPTEVYGTSKLTLKEMEEKNLIIPFIDKDGNSCNAYESYAEVTKEAKGYKLKVQLTCNTESDFIVEVLGCYDYGCDECSSSNETAIEYEFIKSFSKKITTLSCPSGYTRSGSTCSKVVDKMAAKENYKDGETLYFPILYKDGERQKIQLATKVEIVTKQIKEYAPAVKHAIIGKQCTDKKIPDPNCDVQCVSYVVNGQLILSCNTCGTITIQDCNDVVTGYTYDCESPYTDGYTGSGSSKQCYKLSNTTETKYSCPTDATESTGSGSTLKCYKYTDGEKVPYCANTAAKPDLTLNKCVLTTGQEFSHYSCEKSGYDLDDKNKVCVKIDKKDATSSSYTKKWTQTKWSTSKTLFGWTATGKTRVIEVK